MEILRKRLLSVSSSSPEKIKKSKGVSLSRDPDTVFAEEDTMDSTMTQPGGKNFIDQMIIAMQDERVVKTMAIAVADLVGSKLKEHIRCLENRVVQLENEVKEKNSEMTHIYDRLDELEQYGRREGIRISGVVETEGECTDDLVVTIGQHIGVKISKKDLNRSHRVGHPEKYNATQNPRPIIVRFKGYYTKRDFVKNASNLQAIKQSNATDVLKKHSLSINDDLTKTRAELAYKVRKMCREKKIDKTWVRDGIIFVKTATGRVVLIKSQSEFQSLVEDTSLKLTTSREPNQHSAEINQSINESFVDLSP
ncbi:hypothetical protein SNE40_013036 [Patella caerulea]|uniref:Uncharacterized protein n=1 Tax=Patella caerulea TaxID=87958 RepID=A0AAN8PGE4_PATCE